MGDFPEINGYKVVSKLGEGGMATVYLAIQENLNRKVAIKVLEPSLLKNNVTAKRFEKEAKTAAMLSHSNIIQIIDTGRIGDYHYIIMEYLEESLGDRIKRATGGKLHPEIALDICEEIIKALDYAHFRGVFHRDIKPDNIMFRQDGTPVLVDFGIARVLDSPDHLTRSGQSLGTVYYMSPEQAVGKKYIDGRSDIYSLGVVLFEMFTGRKPYEGESAISVALMHIQEPVPRLPRELNHYQPLIDKMMAKDREQRLKDSTGFIKLLDKIFTSPIPGPPTSQQNPVTMNIINKIRKSKRTFEQEMPAQ
ncbi:MAG: protein kinase [Candidatus Aminicenantes bacterium]|nr:protein kinase [Candidatus Aminicenantes bacterium]NIM84005.1 protein kinase [Candidatus Aminicenantes bacterium]NIN23483.1 protein kinase [Candidatus Aminicenantes bacterium]NIN47188.1 protein kinase [Candidatus Aminicenantes bacterium]NIN90112.1 protein kinase [Candidatus Aminicenantes bacterium]